MLVACLWCEKEIEANSGGRPRLYCCAAHRRSAYKYGKRQERAAAKRKAAAVAEHEAKRRLKQERPTPKPRLRLVK